MMRKILISLLATTICLGCFSVTFAKDFREDTIDTLLVPYIEVLKKLNADIGINLFSLDDRKESVYEYYKRFIRLRSLRVYLEWSKTILAMMFMMVLCFTVIQRNNRRKF